MKHTMLAVAAAALLAGSSAIALAQTNDMGTNSNMGTNNGASAPSTAPQSGAENSDSNGTTTGAMSGHGRGPMAMSATRVKHIQSALDQKGEHVKVDGKWGKQTAAAVRNFQKQNGLPTTGRVDHQTMQKLGVSG
jgi:peptidoglycan hydrolase-like protein with peptidoglycan-binding domain